MSQKKDDPLVVFARYSGIAMLLPASTFAGYAIGYGLDCLFVTHFLRIVFLVIGTVAGFIQLVRGITKE
jgi:F0F1-type ATP synthase assembly protein I